jgi:hypothetical protein
VSIVAGAPGRRDLIAMTVNRTGRSRRLNVILLGPDGTKNNSSKKKIGLLEGNCRVEPDDEIADSVTIDVA